MYTHMSPHRLCWCLPCGFSSPIPYFYAIYFAALLRMCTVAIQCIAVGECLCECIHVHYNHMHACCHRTIVYVHTHVILYSHTHIIPTPTSFPHPHHSHTHIVPTTTSFAPISQPVSSTPSPFLTVHREMRDDQSCRRKYGKDWDKYCALVPYRIIPFVY